ncbi:endospore germination permease [Cohnella zeiphila]|uniref:Endospore germination permease n=1 Tax=Cohnella zeiphila TaxID=2761120 RepID=A0A7X0SR71_9BACL|nr:endospore germination permease [Cohnella zeiphila]
MKITGTQLFWILFTVEVVMAVWLRISPAIEVSRQDAWISMLVAGMIGAAITFLVVCLSLQHPGQSLAVFSRKLLGKWVGGLLVLPYLASWYILAGDVLRTFADFVHLILLDRTPLWVIMFLMAAMMTVMTGAIGMNGIARFCEIAGPLTLITLILSFLLNIGNVNLSNLFPVIADTGWKNILKAAYPPASFFGESFLLLVIVSMVQRSDKALLRSMTSIITIVGIVLVSTIMVLFVFGPNVSAKMRFPYFTLVRSINILDFIQNVDIFVLFIWVFGVCAKISFYLFLTSFEMANCLGLKNWRKVVWFSAPLIVAIAVAIPNETAIEMLQKLWRLIVIPLCGIAIPMLLLLATAISKRREARRL